MTERIERITIWDSANGEVYSDEWFACRICGAELDAASPSAADALCPVCTVGGSVGVQP